MKKPTFKGISSRLEWLKLCYYAIQFFNANFHYNQLMDALVSSGLSLSSAKRIRPRLLDMEILVKEGDSYRFANRKWRSNLKNRWGDLGSR